MSSADEDLDRRFQSAATVGRAHHEQLSKPDGLDEQPGQPDEPYCSSLEDWVVSVFAPTFMRRSTPTFRWCAEWWRHPEAISRLEALWRSWEALRLDPLLGMGTWYRDHLDHQLPVLTAAAGPFAECDPTRHFPPETDRLAHTSAPADWWPPSRG
jgi:hypothetical protein